MKRSLKTKMIAGFGVVIILMLSANAYITYTIFEISETTRNIIDSEINAVTLSEQLKDIIRHQDEAVEAYLADPDSVPGESFRRNSAMFYAAMDSLFFTFSDPGSEGMPVMHRISKIHAVFDSAVTSRGDTAGPPVMVTAGAESLQVLHDLFDSLILIHREATGARVSALEERTGASIRVAIVLTVSTLFVALIIAIVIPSKITRLIDALIRGVEGIGKGRLKPIKVESDDEITLLAGAVNDLSGKLRETNELRGEITQQILHEIQSPLGAILSAQFLLSSRERDTPNDVDRQLLESIRESVERISATISQLLDIARLDTGKMEYRKEAGDVTTLLKSIVDGVKVSAARKKIDIVFNPGRVPPLTMDAPKMTVVFNNILLNALKFTGENGRIEIRVRDNGDSVSIAFTDNGVGIAENHLPEIFTRFYTAGGSGRAGTGIGLSMAKAFTEGHGGTITVESKPDAGSTFTVHLPVETPPV